MSETFLRYDRKADDEDNPGTIPDAERSLNHFCHEYSDVPRSDDEWSRRRNPLKHMTQDADCAGARSEICYDLLVVETASTGKKEAANAGIRITILGARK